MTAAVRPTTTVRVTAADPRERAGQYRAAAARWAAFTAARGWTLCVVETSGATRAELGLSDPRVLFVPHTPTPGLAERGKGALEAEAVDHAARWLAGQGDGWTVMHKVTGRLYVRNAALCLARPVVEAAVHVRRTVDRSFCDTRLLSCSVGLWSTQLAGMAAEVDDERGRYLETVLAKRLIDGEYLDRLSVHRFPRRPEFAGRSGSTGQRYDAPLRRVAQRLTGRAEPFLTGRLRRKQG